MVSDSTLRGCGAKESNTGFAMGWSLGFCFAHADQLPVEHVHLCRSLDWVVSQHCCQDLMVLVGMVCLLFITI